METVKVTKKASMIIEGLRSNEECENLQRIDIANAFSTCADLLNFGRDSENVAIWCDDIIKIMYVLHEYNDLMNELSITSDRKDNRYELSQEQ